MSVSLLSPGQIAKRTYDDASGAVRTIPANETTFNIEISADDGDSAIVRSEQISANASITSTNTGIIVPEMSVVGINKISLYTKTTSILVGSQVCTLEVSPSESGDIWVATTTTVSPSITNSTVIVSTIGSILAKRARVRIAAAISSGTFDIYLLGNQ